MAFYCDFKTKLRLKILFERKFTSAMRFLSVNVVCLMRYASVFYSISLTGYQRAGNAPNV